MKKKVADNFLLYIPRKKHNEWIYKDGSIYLIFHHYKIAEKLARWLVKKPCVNDIKLDSIGSCVWNLIDGEKTVYDVGQDLLKEFGDSCQPIYERLAIFIRYMNRKGWIALNRGNQNI
jgi:hypothetical protein